MNKCAKLNHKDLLPYQRQVARWLAVLSQKQTMYSPSEQGNQMKVTTLDKRHTGYGKFKYSVDCFSGHKSATVVILHRWREWCWEVFGPGIELRFAVDSNGMAEVMGIDLPNRWAWQTEFGNHKLYFKDDETMSSFLFQWSK
jgi:hypothetical protein